MLKCEIGGQILLTLELSVKRYQLQRFDLLSEDPDNATLATQLKWPFNIGGCT